MFVDAGVFIALLSERDRYHDRAGVRYAELNAGDFRMVTTNLVVAETANWLMREKSAGHRATVQFGNFTRNWARVTVDELGRVTVPTKRLILHSTPDIEKAAWDILERYDTAGFSFTDCVSFAVMQALSITKAFTFDSHFDVLGFERLQPDT